MNIVALLGKLGRDFDVSQHQKGNKAFFVAKNSLAITKKWINESGDKVEHTDWIPITLFGKSAENAGIYFKKGSTFACEGKITTNSYVDEKGQTKYGWGVDVHRFHFTSKKDDSATSQNTAPNLPELPQELQQDLEEANKLTEQAIENAPETRVEFDADNEPLPF